jgi:hypothetical protein
MKDLMKNWSRYLLSESSLSRIYQHVTEHDTALLTAFRDDASDLSSCLDVAAEGNLSNKERNRDLKATLLSLGYGVTAVDGSFIENYGNLDKQVEVKEDSFFVVNLNGRSDFTETITGLGTKYCQDSVLIVPQGGDGAYLYGTNNTDFPGIDSTIEVGDFFGGSEAEFMTRVRGRPIVFKEGKGEYKLDIYENHSRNSRMAIKAIAKKVLGED